MKLQLMNGRQFFITLPNQIVKAKGWKKSQKLKLELDGRGNIIIKEDKEDEY